MLTLTLAPTQTPTRTPTLTLTPTPTLHPTLTLTRLELDLPPQIVAVATQALLLLSFAGITYGVMSTSWDEEDEGSALGFTEFVRNVGMARGDNEQRRVAVMANADPNPNPNPNPHPNQARRSDGRVRRGGRRGGRRDDEQTRPRQAGPQRGAMKA